VLRAMNGHILIEDVSTSQAADIRVKVEQVIREQYHISHTTLQMECQKCSTNELFCQLDKSCKPEEDHKEDKE
jgi:cobalt-zinc-cadmium efflux system protein